MPLTQSHSATRRLLLQREQYGLTALIDTATDPEYKDEYCCAAFVTSKLAEENPKAAAAFTRAVQKASQWVQENPDETAKIITEKEYVSGDADFCAQILKTYNYKPSVQGGYDALKQNAEELDPNWRAQGRYRRDQVRRQCYIFFDDVPDAPESNASTDTATKSTKASSVSFQPAAAEAEGRLLQRQNHQARTGTQTQRHNIVFTGRKGLCRN